MTTPTLDRRLIVRVYRVWKKYAADGYPRRAQIDPREFGGDWANCLLIDLDTNAPEQSRFSHVGDHLRDPSWPTFDRQSVAECLEGSLLELVTARIPELVEQRKAISFGGPAVHDEGDILYRCTMLPLSETGERIDGILAAIGYREVSVGRDISMLDGHPGERPAAPRLDA